MKKVFGILLISLATLIALGVFTTIPNTIIRMAQAIQHNDIGIWAHFVGIIVGNISMIAIIFLLIWLGDKLLQQSESKSLS